MEKRLPSKLAGILTMVFIPMIFTNLAEAGECVRVARDCIEPGQTRIIDGRSVYRDCWRYKDAYKCSGYARNSCSEYKDAAYCMPISSECIAHVGNWCVAQKHTYKCEEEKYVRCEKRFRYPTFKKENDRERKRVTCNEKIRCVDGKCFDWSDANNELGQAAGMLAALKEMQSDYEKYLSIFKGKERSCAKKAFGLNVCCKEGDKDLIEETYLISQDYLHVLQKMCIS
ncbi:conjugal transfer mating pair stabilization protein TraN [Alphaproteobacteria bacterium]